MHPRPGQNAACRAPLPPGGQRIGRRPHPTPSLSCFSSFFRLRFRWPYADRQPRDDRRRERRALSRWESTPSRLNVASGENVLRTRRRRESLHSITNEAFPFLRLSLPFFTSPAFLFLHVLPQNSGLTHTAPSQCTSLSRSASLVSTESRTPGRIRRLRSACRFAALSVSLRR